MTADSTGTRRHQKPICSFHFQDKRYIVVVQGSNNASEHRFLVCALFLMQYHHKQCQKYQIPMKDLMYLQTSGRTGKLDIYI